MIYWVLAISGFLATLFVGMILGWMVCERKWEMDVASAKESLAGVVAQSEMRAEPVDDDHPRVVVLYPPPGVN